MVESNDIPTGQNVENMLFEVLGLVFHSESFHLVNTPRALQFTSSAVSCIKCKAHVFNVLDFIASPVTTPIKGLCQL